MNVYVKNCDHVLNYNFNENRSELFTIIVHFFIMVYVLLSISPFPTLVYTSCPLAPSRR